MKTGDEFWKIEVRVSGADPRGCSVYGSHHVDHCSLDVASEFSALANAVVALGWIRDIEKRSERTVEHVSDRTLTVVGVDSYGHQTVREYAVVRWLRVSDSRAIRAPFELASVAAVLTEEGKRDVERALCAAMARELAAIRPPKGTDGAVYEVVDDDGRMLILAVGFFDAIETWRARIQAENPDSDMTTHHPTEVVRLCEPNEFLCSPEVDLG